MEIENGVSSRWPARCWHLGRRGRRLGYHTPTRHRGRKWALGVGTQEWSVTIYRRYSQHGATSSSGRPHSWLLSHLWKFVYKILCQFVCFWRGVMFGTFSKFKLTSTVYKYLAVRRYNRYSFFFETKIWGFRRVGGFSFTAWRRTILQGLSSFLSKSLVCLWRFYCILAEHYLGVLGMKRWFNFTAYRCRIPYGFRIFFS